MMGVVLWSCFPAHFYRRIVVALVLMITQAATLSVGSFNFLPIPSGRSCGLYLRLAQCVKPLAYLRCPDFDCGTGMALETRNPELETAKAQPLTFSPKPMTVRVISRGVMGSFGNRVC